MPKIIEVIPNPYIALDKDGVPQGAVGAGMPGIFIGAAVDPHASKMTGKQRFYYPLDRDGKPEKRVHFSADIVTSVQAGELIAANKATARACGISDKEYLEPAAALEAEKKKALAYWQSVNLIDGKPDPNAKVGEIPRKPSEPEDGETVPVETAALQITPTLKKMKQEV